MAKEKKVQIAAGKLFGLIPDPVRKVDFICYHIVECTVDSTGKVINSEKSEQSWLLWEAKHKLENRLDEAIIEMMKDKKNE